MSERRTEGVRNGRKKKKRNPYSGIIKLFISIIILIVVVFICIRAGKSMFNIAKNTTNSDKNKTTSQASGEIIKVTIPEGASTADIASILRENGLISSEIGFRFSSRTEGFDGTYKHGTYDIEMGLDNESIMQLLQQGGTQNDKSRITIPEGYTVNQIAAYLEEKEIVTAEEFLNEINNGEFNFDFLDSIPPEREIKLEGYLFPDTYFLSENPTANEIINKMLVRFDEIYNDEYRTAVKNSKYSLDEIIRIASMIESEIRMPDERARASGVIYNRLNIDMPLQIDSTVLYAKGLKKEVVTFDDLEIDSPYNTYQNKGLPVGPICNPGAEAIKAAIFPEENKFLYYVLKDRTSGEHIYTETYDEFLKAKEKYKQNF